MPIPEFAHSSVGRRFASTFLPSLLLLTLLLVWSVHLMLDSELSRARNEQAAVLSIRLAIIQEDFANGVEKILALAKDPALAPVLAENTPARRARLEEALLTLLLRNRDFDKARWIDENGHEQVRVDRRDGEPAPLAASDLQDKSQRYFFREGMGLSVGQVYLSPLDLNMEHGEIEQPIRPTLRFATPVRDTEGRRRGLLVINLHAATLLEKLPRQHFTGSRLLWLDGDGHWLRAAAPADEWAHQRGGGDTFAQRHPELWQTMNRTDQASLRDDRGLWTWTAFDPRAAPFGAQLGQAPRWWLVSWLSAGILNSHLYAILLRLLPVFIAAVLLTAAFSFHRARQRQKEEALFSLHRATVNAALDCIIVIDASGHVVEFNPAAERCFGFSRAEAIGRRLSETIVPDRYREAHERGMRHYLRTGEGPVLHQRFEIEAIHKDGTEFPVELAIEVAHSQTGDVFVAYLRDITQRQQDQQALLDSQAQARAEATRMKELLSVASDGVHILNDEGCIVLASESFAHGLGYATEEVTGLHVSRWDALFTPEELDRKLAELFAAEDILTFETRHRRRDGAVIDVEVTSHATRIEDERLLFCASRDISERKRMQTALEQYRQHLEDLVEKRTDELKRNQALLQAIVTTTPNGLLLVDRAGVIRMTNTALERMFGYENAELIGQPLEKLVPPAHREIHTQLRGDYLRQPPAEAMRPMGTGLNLQGQRKDGSCFPIDVSLATFTVRDIVYAQATVMDMTEPRRAADALRDANATLEEKVAIRTAELAAANAAKSEFLANMSHEIRTPMNGILGLAQLLEDEPLASGQREMVERIRQSGRSLLAILNDILDFSKIEAGQLRIDPQPFMLGPPLAQMGSLLGVTARAKGLDLRIDTPPDISGALVGDSLRIEHVLGNLIGNAIKFTQRGEVQVRVLPVSITEAAACLRFEVKDTGIGIDPDKLTTLFQPFAQADASITRRYGGTGLGLSISKRLVELMGGEIGVDSTPGVGSTFWFTLPFERSRQQRPEPVTLTLPTHPREPRLTGLRVLVVDDTQTNRMIVRRMLAKEGANVTEAVDGQQALDHLRAAGGERPDAVLMDLQMPVMDGTTATRAIREELGLWELPVIAFTAGVLPEQRQAALNVGCNDFLAKPVDKDELVAMLLRWTTNPTLELTGAMVEEAPAFPILEDLDLQKAAYALGGDLDLVKQLLRQIVNDFAGAAPATRADLDRGDRTTAARRLHSLKGALGYVAAADLIQATHSLEEAILAEQTELGILFAEFERQLTRFMTAARIAQEGLPR